MTVMVVSFGFLPASPSFRRAECSKTLGELNDHELLEAVRRGHMDAYGILFTRYNHLAVSTARWILGSHDLAVDAAHEAFSRILAAIRAGSGPHDTFRGYLRATVTREARKQVRRRAAETPVPEHPESSHPIEDFAGHLIDASLRTAFQSLPPRWQLVIWHLDIEDMPLKDVAPLFNLSPNALASLHRRAKRGFARAYDLQVAKRPEP
ncbi:RNA polymerase sigma factor [Paenarthrobacter nitroguajacolicus]|uniref:RNA polymerase sigma factor n=1 Tax=Paenarthrobacter nitroguajacolicus TaxID=211146 RepID=UPI0040538F6E